MRAPSGENGDAGLEFIAGEIDDTCALVRLYNRSIQSVQGLRCCPEPQTKLSRACICYRAFLNKVPLKSREHGIYGDLIVIYPKAYYVYLWGNYDVRRPS